MKNSNPFISVVIPVYNRAHIINKSIDSVLSQTYKYFEVIIVDDGSKDNVFETISVYRDDRIHYIKHPTNLGATAARNTGIKAAKGEWIAFLDSDDIWINTKLEEQAKEIYYITDEYAVIHCGLQYVDFHTGMFLTQRTSRGNINDIVKYNIGIIPQTSTWLVKKNVLFDVGLFDINMPAHQESELGLRIAQKYKYWLIDKVLVYVTRNHNQIRNNNSLYIKAKEMLLANYEDIFANQLKYNFCTVIAGDSIINGDFNKAKKYLKSALHYSFNLKSLSSFTMLSILPGLTAKLYLIKYKKYNRLDLKRTLI